MFNTITEFLESTGGKLRFYDMGRRIAPIPPHEFLEFELARSAYPLPLQQQAWFALAYQAPASSGDPSIWFLRLPLDETGCLVLAARDDLLHRMFESSSKNLVTDGHNSPDRTNLEDNPFNFRPRPECLAVVHAKLSAQMRKPASHFYAHARRYFSGEIGWEQWPFLGYQGIADISARLTENDNQALLKEAIPHLPIEPLEALCQCLENEHITASVAGALLTRAESNLHLDQPDARLLTSVIRGISMALDTKLPEKLVNQVLRLPCGTDKHILGAIAARAWELLQQGSCGARFLECLASCTEEQDYFDQTLADLLYLPNMRTPILNLLRQPERSDRLAQCIGAFFQTVRQPSG